MNKAARAIELKGRADAALPRNPQSENDRVDDREKASVWRYHLWLFAPLLLATLLLFGATFWSMVTTWWRSETFAHGFIVVPISIYLIWRKRDVLRNDVPSSSPSALVPLLLLAIAWLLGNAADVLGVQQLAATVMIPMLVALVFGWHIMRRLIFPLTFLLLAVPIGEFLVPYLVDFTASFTVHALQLTGVPVYWEGNRFSLPSGDWSVIKACSGVRYLYATLTVALLYVYLNFRSRWRQAVFLALAVTLAIFANGVRAYAIVMIGHLSEMRLAVGIDHFIYGWVFFALLMVLLFWIGTLLREPDSANQRAEPPVDAHAPGSLSQAIFATAAGFVVMLAFPAWAMHVDSAAPPAVNSELRAPSSFAGWYRSTGNPITDWKPIYVNPTETVSADYAQGAEKVGLYVAYYGAQHQGSELINFQNVLAKEKAAWHVTAQRSASVNLAGDSREVKESRLRAGEGDLLVWQWYWANGHHLDSPYWVKFHEAIDKLTVGRRRGAGIVVYTSVDDTVAEARKRLAAFTVSAMPALDASFDAVKSASADR